MIMKCPFCFAQDPKYFMDGVCRRCIHLETRTHNEDYYLSTNDSDYYLKFELTDYQKRVAKKVSNLLLKEDVFLEAVCGAGKTEMCYETIKHSIKQGLKVGWAIPRRQVVLELQARIDQDFKDLKVVSVCEGYRDNLYGDLIICTTHQLFRYNNYFDILILDEPDAFPFHQNELLFDLMKASVKGHILFMSATKDAYLSERLSGIKHINMPLRPNLKPMPIPVLKSFYFKFIQDLIKLKDEKVLIFVPTIKLARLLSIVLRIPYVCSKTDNKEEIIDKFDKDIKAKLISTTVLERGVTFLNSYVLVLFAHHIVFNESSLVQISGRVKRGRSTKGECYFYTHKKSKEVENCILNLKQKNKLAESVLQEKNLDIIF